MQVIMSDTAPKTNLVLALVALFFCPFFGCIAVYHALQVAPLWRARNILASYYHSGLV
jgi:hypothetical protein